MMAKIRLKERDAILQSLKAGVTPKIGIQHIQVGRANEIKALYGDIERISDGGAAFRLIIGEYGSGKTFFLSVIRSIALEKKFVVVQADLSPNRRLQGSAGQARNLYSELMHNLSTRNKPDGNALTSVIEKFISKSRSDADSLNCEVTHILRRKLSEISELVGGYDFAKVIEAYWQGYEEDNDNLKNSAIRWLRAEYTTKTEARMELGVRNIITDSAFYDMLKIMSLFVRQAGYSGLIVNLDEMVNLYKLSNTQSRTSNYEQILRMLNDCLQGSAEYIGFLLGGTPEFLFDSRKGLFSYEALQSRLAENSFAKKAGVIDFSSPTLHLANLTPEEMYILLKNLRHVYASGDSEKYLVPDIALENFLNHCNNTIGDAYFRTPRNTIKAFLDMLAVIDQNSDINWDNLISSTTIEEELPSGMASDSMDIDEETSNEMASFRL